MTQSHRWCAVLITIVLASVFCSCVSSRPQQQFAMSFLPAPLPVAIEAEQPSPISNLYQHSMPNLAQTTLPQIDWPTEVDSRIVRADRHFDAGKKIINAATWTERGRNLTRPSTRF